MSKCDKCGKDTSKDIHGTYNVIFGKEQHLTFCFDCYCSFRKLCDQMERYCLNKQKKWWNDNKTI